MIYLLSFKRNRKEACVKQSRRCFDKLVLSIWPPQLIESGRDGSRPMKDLCGSACLISHWWARTVKKTLSVITQLRLCLHSKFNQPSILQNDFGSRQWCLGNSARYWESSTTPCLFFHVLAKDSTRGWSFNVALSCLFSVHFAPNSSVWSFMLSIVLRLSFIF